jgi:hypothetical protein
VYVPPSSADAPPSSVKTAATPNTAAAVRTGTKRLFIVPTRVRLLPARNLRRVRAAPTELDKFLQAFVPPVRATLLALRTRVLTFMPNAHETVWDATNALSVVYSPNAKWQSGICHLPAYSKHVNLGFNQGAHLPDPRGVLKGTGAAIRHVTFRDADDVVAADWIEGYLADALIQAELDNTMGDGGTTIRQSDGPRRNRG